MSFKSTIRVPNVHGKLTLIDCGLVGVSSVDHNVYVWQYNIQQVPSPSTLVIHQVNPLVPSSWNIFKVLNQSSIDIGFLCSCFNYDCSKMAFRYTTADTPSQVEVVSVDMTSGQTEKRSVDQFVGHGDVIQFAETSVGYVDVSSNGEQVFCYKTFPVPGENRILVTFGWSTWNINSIVTGLTYDSFMYITFSNSQQHPWKVCKLVSYNFLSGTSTEIAFDQWDSSAPYRPYRGPFLIANSNRSYLIRPSENFGNGVYLVEYDHVGIKLTYLNQLCDQFIDRFLYPSGLTAGNNKIAMIHTGTPFAHVTRNNYLLTVANVTVPSLKSLAVWAIQKHCGTFGNDGELLGGISEEKLKKAIRYQGNKKLF